MRISQKRSPSYYDKLRYKIPATASKEEMDAVAKADPQIIAQLEGKTIVKTVLVVGKMVNFVVK